MRGFKPAETLGMVGFGAFSLVLSVVSVVQVYGAFSVLGDDPGSGVLRLLYAVVGFGIAFSLARTAWVRFRFAQIRRDMAVRPEVFFEGHPYEALLLADEDLTRLARKVGGLCGRYPTNNPTFLRFLVEYEKALGEYQPGSLRTTEEIRRLEEAADRGLAERPPSEGGERARESGRIG